MVGLLRFTSLFRAKSAFSRGLFQIISLALLYTVDFERAASLAEGGLLGEAGADGPPTHTGGPE